jgi:hypothetical protein
MLIPAFTGIAMTCTSASSAAPAETLQVQQNEVAQWRGQSSRAHADPFNQITLDAIVTLPDGSEQRVPAFWAGKQEWRFRFSSPGTGRYPFRTVCSDTADAGLHDQRGVLEVTPYQGSNPLLQHGPIHRLSACQHPRKT